jgi:hypothetical protein
MPSPLRTFNAAALTSAPGLNATALAADSATYDGRKLTGILVKIGPVVTRDTPHGFKRVRLATFTIPKTVLKTEPASKKLMTYSGVSYEIERVGGAAETDPAWIVKCSAAVK